MKKIVVLSGAGISAESGLNTFRDHDGLWENYSIMEVATPEAWKKQPQLVLEFYNQRREDVRNARPNAAHFALADLEQKFDVHIVTQNIDDLHERSGSSKVLHLHGEIFKARSTVSDELYDLGQNNIYWGDLCMRKSQLRPHVVWFGEEVPLFPEAEAIVSQADILIIVGTSLAVYPAAILAQVAPAQADKYLIDPKEVAAPPLPKMVVIKEKASTGIPMLANQL
jgi:NAD-dependent deacetylase